jgi:hypothetical protein
MVATVLCDGWQLSIGAAETVRESVAALTHEQTLVVVVAYLCVPDICCFIITLVWVNIYQQTLCSTGHRRVHYVSSHN